MVGGRRDRYVAECESCEVCEVEVEVEGKWIEEKRLKNKERRMGRRIDG